MSTDHQPLSDDQGSTESDPVSEKQTRLQLSPAEQHHRLKELAQVFFKLGTIAFGGPAAHIAMMDDEVVKRRQWFDREKLLDLIGVTNLLPGPNSTELAIHIGFERAGWKGLFVAGSCFILPAMVMVWMLAAVYDQYRTLPEVGWLLYGIKPVIMAIILQALWKLGKKAIKDAPTVLAAVGVIIGYFFGINEILLLLLAGLAVMVIENLRSGRQAAVWLFPLSGLVAQTGGPAPTAAAAAASGIQVFWFFLKIGSVLYGSGYVLLAFLQRDLVERMQWLTSQELLDAIAIGQFTPGPVFTTATFVGYLVGGNGGGDRRHHRHLFTRLSVSGHRQPLGALPASLPLVWHLFERSKCRFPGSNGRCHLDPGARSHCGWADHQPGGAGCDRRLPVQPQFCLDCPGGGTDRLCCSMALKHQPQP